MAGSRLKKKAATLFPQIKILHKLIGKTEWLYEIKKNTLSYCKVIVENNSLGLACVLDDAVLLDTDLALGGLKRIQSN